jgi:hypothetical protein
MSLLVIPATKHKIWYSYTVLLQTFSTVMLPHIHTKETNKCSYAFRGYKMAKLLLWWCMHGANLRQKFPWFSNSCKLYQQIPVYHTTNFQELFEATTDNVLHLNIQRKCSG